MDDLVQYYNKFNEEKRLDSRHGQVEYRVSMKYIHEYIPKELPKEEVHVSDSGAERAGFPLIPVFRHC